MLDIGWSELLLIAVVAIVVIGPKDLPDALRTLGRMMTKIRRMAGEFQGQFNQALREANLEDVKKDFDEIRQSASVLRGGLNPAEMARNEIRGAITGTSASSGPATAASSPGPLIDPAMTSSSATADEAPAASAGPEEGAQADDRAPEPIPSAFATSPSFRPKS
jgi:sec-independent protein translocase protein TatB